MLLPTFGHKQKKNGFFSYKTHELQPQVSNVYFIEIEAATKVTWFKLVKLTLHSMVHSDTLNSKTTEEEEEFFNPTMGKFA